MAKRLEVNHVSFSYENNLQVLDDISLDAGEGDFVVLLGASGCGKTTLLNIIKSITNSDEAFNILQNELGAKIYISLICVWAWSGFYIIILFSAMENIDPNIYIAAKLDGAKAIRIFRIIILPIVRPVLILITLLAVCSTFQLYVEISLLTKGGPGVSTYTLSYYLYRKTFTYVADYGYSSAIGVSILLINAFFSIIVLKIRQGKE